MGTLSCGHSPPIYRHLVCYFYIKTLIIMFISTNIHTLYVRDHLGPYILPINNYVDLLKPYLSNVINYMH